MASHPERRVDENPFRKEVRAVTVCDLLILAAKLLPTIVQLVEFIVKKMWSREASPCRISAVGLRHPLREPYLPLSGYTALLSLVPQITHL